MNQQRLNRIIDDYRKIKQVHPDKVIEYCKKQDSLKKVIEIGALARDEYGVKHNHQKRIPLKILIELKEKLLMKIKDVEMVNNFDDLCDIIGYLKINGIGDLTIYDAAHRIGIILNKLPDKVYLHCGSRVGAEKLLGKIKDKYITKDSLPEPLKSCDLTCAELEDLLCIFKDRL